MPSKVRPVPSTVFTIDDEWIYCIPNKAFKSDNQNQLHYNVITLVNYKCIIIITKCHIFKIIRTFIFNSS